MPSKRRIKRKKKKTGKYRLIPVLLIAAAVILVFFSEFGREKAPERVHDFPVQDRRAETPPPAQPPSRAPELPQVAIVMDDLGNNRAKAEEVLRLNAPLTLSVLPQRRYSEWTAEEGHRLGHDIIVHIPMEATRPLKLGEGGLYVWMTDSEIRKSVEENIVSVPHIIGVSNHMGSAFTRNRRGMEAFMKVLKRKGLFFLDSVTTSGSVGFELAEHMGVKALRRDIFLDNSDDPEDIALQWKRLVKKAAESGRAIALAHPRENTLVFLREQLKGGNEVAVVPLSTFIVD